MVRRLGVALERKILLAECRALLIEHRALLSSYIAQSTVHRLGVASECRALSLCYIVNLEILGL